MKKILLPILTLGGLLFAASCQMDEPDAGTLTGEVDFSITAGIPSGITTYTPTGSGSHNGGAMLLDPEKYTLRYTLEVYDKEDKLAYEDTKEAVDFGGVTFDVRLLAKVYDFVFWADFVKKDGTAFYNVDNLKNITYASTEVSAQELADDAADAYYKKEEVDLTQSSKSLDVKLQRPFGKIRLIATDVLDGNNKQTEIPETVTIDFGNALIPTAFNAFEGKVIEGSTEDAGVVNFLANKETTMVNNQEKKDVYLLGINYIFESSAIPSYSMDVTVTSDKGNIIGQRSLSSIPVQENKLTTVVGNFYTNEGNLEVKVEDMFTNGEEEVPVPIVIGSYEDLSKAFIDGGDYMLSSDITIPENQIVKISEGTTVGINLNDHTLSTTNSEGQTFQDMFEVVGTLNISNGTVQFQYIGGNMGWDGGTAVFNVHGGGILNMEDVVVNNLGGTDMSFCVHLNNWGEVTLNADNCEFNSPYCGVRVFNSGPQMNNVLITNSTLTGATRAFWVHNYIGDIPNATEEEIKNRLNIKIYNNNNTFSLTGTAISPIRYGFGNPVYFTEKEELVDLVIDDSKKTVQISSASAMSAFAVMVNNGKTFKNYTVTLDADIDLNNQPWTPIGTSTNAFKGNFDGKGHKISNLKAGTNSQSDVGLFGHTTDGTIKNIHIHNAEIKGYLDVGVVAGTPYTTEYSNIKVTGLIKVDGFSYVGGMFGKNVYANLTDLTIDADEGSYVRAESNNYRTYVGGVVGFMGEGGHSVSDVNSNIDVYGSTCDVGGITGIAHYNNKFINCFCKGNVTLENAQDSGDQLEIGGIAGVWQNESGTVTFTNCSFTGTLITRLNGVDYSEEIAVTNKITGRAYSTTGTGQLIIN